MARADGALANVRVAHGGVRPGYLYRERPVAEWDTGWRVFVGDEDGPALVDPANSIVVSVASLVRRWPDLAPLLGASPGAAYERAPDGRFVEVTGEA